MIAVLRLAGMLVVVAFAVKGMLSLATPKSTETSPIQLAAPVVTVFEVHEEHSPRKLERYARLAPVKEWVLSLEVSGRLAERPIENGAHIAKDQLLVALESEPFAAELEDAGAVLAEAEAQLALAEPRLRRIERIIQTNSASSEQLDEARADHARAVASRRAAEAQVRLAFTMTSFIAVVGLAGVVVNDSIVLVAAFNRLRKDDGLTTDAAIVEAVRRRFRPILMTSLTTILGLMPMAVGFGGFIARSGRRSRLR